MSTTMSILNQLILTFGSLQLLLLAVLCVIATVLWRRPRNLPPGPTPLPVVGNVLSLITDARDSFLVITEWSKKYGDVFTVYSGPIRTIVLNGYAAIHEALVKNSEVFSSRPPSGVKFGQDGKTTGLVSEPYGQQFKERRRFVLMSLRDYGLGKKSLEGKILEEARFLSEDICQKRSHAFCISQMMDTAVSNVICSVLFGCRYDYDDIKFKDLLTAMHQIFSVNSVQYLACRVPPLRFIPGVRKGYLEFRCGVTKLKEHIKERIREHEQTFDPNDIRDFMDAFLLESKKRHLDENTTFTEQQHVEIVFQLFNGGSDATATTLRWAFLYMILHSDIQGKVQQEIDSVLGPNQEPSMVHRSQDKFSETYGRVNRKQILAGKIMPYTEATLTELSRLVTVTPFTVFHATSNDTIFRGYNIPKDTTVWVNLWSVHHDPQLWPEPSKFDPTRFLDDTGNYMKRKEVIPFSIGRRSCLGEQLARMELFLTFTFLLQRFTFELPEGAPKPSEKGIFGLTRAPVPFKLIAKLRN